ncbi:MAG: DUF4277 domain-containing protein [Symploca sp. SIO3C6]|nr:DUF4277 domain-containing protein [Symploca sp. SIO3C6]
MTWANEIQVKTLNHLGIIAGIIDEIGIVEIINDLVGMEPKEIINAGVVVKAIILNGLGFVSRPLSLFPQFFAVSPGLYYRSKTVTSPVKAV